MFARRPWQRLFALLFTLSCSACTTLASAPDLAALEAEVRATETAFAGTMAERDFEAFRSYLAPDTVFFAGDRPLRGAEAVAAAWQPLYAAPSAPFAWAPEVVVVQEGGALALSSGPVTAPDGRQIGVFNSIWRREPDGRWRIVFDKGGDWCGDR